MMANPTSPNTRASLLSGLRTGGVRSVSSPLGQAPHTAGATGSFIRPRMSSSALRNSAFQEEDEDRRNQSYSHYGLGITNNGYRPQTSAVDGSNNRMMSQQQRSSSNLNANSPAFVPGGFSVQTPAVDNNNQSQAQLHAQAQADAQTMAIQQLQILQLEMMARKLNYQGPEAIQAAYLSEALRVQMSQQGQIRRGSAGYTVPQSAGPLNSFGHIQNQARRGGNADYDEQQSVKTAGIGGKFAPRTVSYDVDYNSGLSPSHTTVISGGTALGTPTSAVSAVSANHPAPSKSEAAVSWRRNGNNNSVLSGNRAPTREIPPTVRITPPPVEQPMVSPLAMKFRPRPLALMAQQLPPAVVVDDADDTSSSASSPKSGPEHSSPTTPNSFSSQDHLPLSPREEASKKLYEGLGFGRAPSAPQQLNNGSGNLRLSSQPIRQPTGPPSGAEEFGPKNFATRIRRKAVGGLGVLMSGRERRLSINEAR